MDSAHTEKPIIEIEVAHGLRRLGKNELPGLNHQLGTMETDAGAFRILVHVHSLCVWLQGPSGEIYELDHRPLWGASVSAIAEHEKGERH